MDKYPCCLLLHLAGEAKHYPEIILYSESHDN